MLTNTHPQDLAAAMLAHPVGRALLDLPQLPTEQLPTPDPRSGSRHWEGSPDVWGEGR